MTRIPAFLHPLPAAARRHLAAVVAVAVLLSSSAGLALAPAASAWDVHGFSADSESQLISLQNQARASAGLRTLKLDTALRSAARWRSRDMVERDYFSHTIPGRGSDHNVFWYLQYEYDYCFKVAGENIGQATWPGASEADVTAFVFGLFMDSDGHRANILGTSWDVVAVGAYRATGDHFVWTALFADRCGSGAAATPKATPKPSPKPTVRETPKPDPTRVATPRPQRTPDRPTATTPTPARTQRPSPSPAPSPSAIPGPLPSPPTASPSPSPIRSASSSPPATAPDPPAPTAGWNGGVLPGAGLRVVDRPSGQGLVDSILSTVSAQFFGS